MRWRSVAVIVQFCRVLLNYSPSLYSYSLTLFLSPSLSLSLPFSLNVYIYSHIITLIYLYMYVYVRVYIGVYKCVNMKKTSIQRMCLFVFEYSSKINTYIPTCSLTFSLIYICCLVGWGRRLHRLLLCRGVRTPPTSVLNFDIKQYDGDVLVMLELWGMRSTLSLPSLPGQLWHGVVVPDRALSMGQIELNSVLTLN